MSKVLPSSQVEASRTIGRVGALAVALGVGAVFFSGGVAWADSSGDTSTTSHARSADDAPASPSSAPRSARRGAPGAAAATNTVGAQRNSRPGAAASRAATAASVDVTPAAVAATPSEIQSSAPAAAPTPAAPTVVAATSAPQSTAQVSAAPAAAVPQEAPATGQVSAIASAGADAVDPLAGGNGSAPINTPLEWTVAAYTRRVGAAAAVPLAAAATPTYSIGACTQQSTSCTYVMGPSGVPIPNATYANAVMKFYVLPNTTQTDTTTQLVFTPEGAYPVTGIKALPLTISAEQGQTILENTMQTLQPGPQPGTMPITVFGFSQSAVITSLLQRDLDTQAGLLPGVDRSQLTFVTVGQEMSPDGGWFARFPGLNAPSLGEYFYGSTPENSYPVTNYTLEYDGFADSPKYPANFLSALNAAMGILLVHTNYTSEKYFANTYGTTLGSFDPVMGTLGPGEACKMGSSSCTELPTTSPTQKYYFIQTPHLPLLAPVRAIPFIGKPLAALVEPVLKVIVNLGYADPAHGFTAATQPDANVPSPFGLLIPNLTSPLVKEIIGQLVAGVKQGIHDFFASFGTASGGSGISLPTVGDIAGLAKEVITTLPARISAGASALYATVLATADFINSALITLPAYDVRLFVEGITQALGGFSGGGLNQVVAGLINSVFRPLAADIGFAATIGVVQVTVWLEGILAALTGCGPAAPQAGLCLVPASET